MSPGQNGPGAALSGDLEEKLRTLGEITQTLQARTREIRDPAEIVLLRDPATGERVPQERKTPSGIVVRFLPFTIGEARSYESQQAGKPFAHWTTAEQVRLYNENVLEPDFRGEEFAGGPLTPEWVEQHFDWLSWVEIGTEVVKGSRADFRVPVIRFEEDEEKKSGPSPPTDSPSRSSTLSSTSGDTGTSDRDASRTSS